MTKLRFDLGTHTPTFGDSWEKDREFRTHPAVVTALLREQVPVLDYVDWRITNIEPGMTVSVLPLNTQSTNQHFTHQAALFLLAADYTGGTALGSLFTGCPIVGVHPVASSTSASLWLLKGEVKYLRPSVADLIVTARIPEERHARIRDRFTAGKPVIETIKVEFHNAGVPVAQATATYFARQSVKLRSEGITTDKVNALYELKLTSSAEMIAGVRARESGKLIHDPYAARMAGQHGMALATRFCERSPQLGGMVASRTWHLDSHLTNFVATGGRDIVIVGVGWDMRPFRLDLPPGTRVFELDYPTTLAERRRRLEQLDIQDPHGVTRVEVPIDLRTMSVASVMREHLEADTKTFIAWEGMSMYFQEDEVRQILDGMRPLLGHRESRLWCDIVDREAVHNPQAFAEPVQKFMRGMQILGEPFTFGVDSVEEFMRANQLHCHEVVTSDVCLAGNSDPVYSVYRFCVASTQPVASETSTFKATRFDDDDVQAPSPRPKQIINDADQQNGTAPRQRKKSSRRGPR